MNQRSIKSFLLLLTLSGVFSTVRSIEESKRPYVEAAAKPYKPAKVGLGLGLLFGRNKVVVPADQLPIVYDPGYDISFFGIEKLHPFDSCKYSKIYKSLVKSGIRSNQFVKPAKVSEALLLTVHNKEYLDALQDNKVLARISEVPHLAYVPNFMNFLLSKKLLGPMKLATGGTLRAVDLAMEKGWAINLAGGYHHAKREGGEGFCFFSDIPLAVNKIREQKPEAKVMIIDLDTHQGNGHESYFCDDKNVAIFDTHAQ